MSRDVLQVCSDNETPFTLPEPITVTNGATVTPPPHHHHHSHQQQQQVLESRDETDCSAAVTRTNGSRQSVTSSRLSVVKVSEH